MSRSRLLKRMIDAGVLKRGTFRLRSGKTSDIYCDVRAVYANPGLLARLAREIAEDLPPSTTCVAASGFGGIPLLVAVALASRLPLTLVRDAPKDHGTGSRIEGYVPKAGDRVVIVDDTLTTGGSIRMTHTALRQTGARVIGARVVVIRNRPKSLPIPIRGLFRLEELMAVFLV